MTKAPRILTVMGSGETSPTMVKTHRENISKIMGKPFGIILDTPFGFQSNADEISTKAIEYFKVSVNLETEVASFRSGAMEAIEQERFFSKLGKAEFIFAGPGSPTYALKQWKNTPVPRILTNRLAKGPAVITFSSAAALTLGSHTVPVYEIYKVGDEPSWALGLDILGAFGIKGAVIPHFNNAEGGNHDTRFCYLGEERLGLMESKLDQDCSIFGIDEHTAVVIDLEAETVRVTGNGGFTVRNQGRQAVLESGSEFPLHLLREVRAFFANAADDIPKPQQATPVPQWADHPGLSPFLETVEQLRLDFDHALSDKDTDGATKTLLALVSEIDNWQNETFQSDEMEQAKSALRSMIVQLGEFAQKGTTEPEEVFGPFVDLIINLRLEARKEKRWNESDQIRDALAQLGIEVRDIPGGSEWFSIGNS